MNQRFIPGSETMRPIAMEQQAAFISKIVAIPGNMSALLQNQASPGHFARSAIGNDTSYRSCSNNHEIICLLRHPESP
jgi:hypothetical protein